jgi:hypothetical protein
VDGEHGRASQDVTPAMRARVLARDKHRCRVPGCRSAQNLEVHHIKHRKHGGSNRMYNLATLCGGHHALHHDGTLIIRGTADALEVSWLHDGPSDTPVDTFHVEIPAGKRNEVTAFQTDATLALKTLGFAKDMAARAVRDAIEHDAPTELESLIKAALKRCSTQ